MDRHIQELARTLKTVAQYSANCEDLLIQFLAMHPEASGEKICRAALYAAVGREKLEERAASMFRELALCEISSDQRSEIRPATQTSDRCRPENYRPSADFVVGKGGEAWHEAEDNLMSQKADPEAKGRTAARGSAEIETAALGVAEAVSAGLWSILAESDREQFRQHVRKARRITPPVNSSAAANS